MKVLVIYLTVPEIEDTKSYILEGEEAELAVKCHNKFINYDEDETGDLDRLSEILHNHEPITSLPFSTEGVDKVVLSGFVL